MVEGRASKPRFRREGKPPAIKLTNDDIEILRHVYRHRFVRSDDLYRLLGRSEDRLSRRLTLLFRNEFLDRPIAQVDRYREGGSRPLVYGLGNTGAKYLKGTLGTPIGATDWRSRNRTYTRENLDHTLAISHYLIDLELACRARPDLKLITFDEILASSPEGTRKSRNPMSWPVKFQWYCGNSTVQIAPDAIFGLRMETSGGAAKRAYFFVEIDRGTMTIAPSERVRMSEGFPYRATILRKLYAYSDSYRQRNHEKQFEINAPRTLFLTTSEARADAMRVAARDIVSQQAKLSPGLFLFGLYDVSDPLSVEFKNIDGEHVVIAASR